MPSNSVLLTSKVAERSLVTHEHSLHGAGLIDLSEIRRAVASVGGSAGVPSGVAEPSKGWGKCGQPGSPRAG
jgi:hypothetical protein